MNRISIGTLDCTQEDIDAVAKAMKSGFLSSGQETTDVEKYLAHTHGKFFGLLVNSGQSALEVAIKLAQIKLCKEDLIIAIPATTYAADLWAILNMGCRPSFCDIDKDYNIDYSSIPDSADVVLSVDLCGKTANIPKEIREKFFIIEDACEAVGNTNCNYGDIICLSFYVSHIITAGCGGMICLNDEQLYDYAKSYIAHGRVYGGDFTKFNHSWINRFKFNKIGVSYRLNNLSASLLLSQTKRLESIINKRKENAKYLIDAYHNDIKLQYDFVFPTKEYAEDSVFQFFPILLKTNLPRNTFLSYLFQNGIDSRVLLSLTDQPIFQKLYGEDLHLLYPNSYNCNLNGFLVGCHQNLSKDDLDRIIQVLSGVI